MCHYKYGNVWNDFLKCAVPRSNYQVESVLLTTRLLSEAFLAIRIHEADAPDVNRRSIQHHLDILTDPTGLLGKMRESGGETK
jgi:hypothetical protein